MTITEIYPKIYLFKFSNQYDLTSTFMRMQEFYESPFDNIREKNFTYEDFFDAYVKNGKLSYWSDWCGFNIPGESLLYFFFTFELNKREYEFFKLLHSKKIDYNNPFYVIGVYQNKDISHELAHGLFAINEKYRIEAQKLVAALSPNDFNKRCQELATSLYTPEVFVDEIQAYGVSNKEKQFLDLYNKYRRI